VKRKKKAETTGREREKTSSGKPEARSKAGKTGYKKLEGARL